MKRRLWDTADRWGPGVVALVALVVSLWYGRQIEGQMEGLRVSMQERVELEGALRNEVMTWQAYVVSLRETMIKAGIRDIPPPPKPVVVNRVGGRTKVTTGK